MSSYDILKASVVRFPYDDYLHTFDLSECKLFEVDTHI
jgi:hypothetical protein